MHNLFHAFAERYDLHTPPDHYFRDQQLVLDLLREHGDGARLLDVGCGTGVLIEKALKCGLSAVGFDASEEMVQVARRKVGVDAAWVGRMQDLQAAERYDLVASLSWCIHYCADETEMADVLRRIKKALVPGGRIVLQVAHSPNLNSEWMQDWECGPTGIEDDVSLRFRFRRDATIDSLLHADYAYACSSNGEAFAETHDLRVTDVTVLRQLLIDESFDRVEIWDSWRRDAFSRGGNVFVTGVRRQDT
ncbi:class I SAM-dependent DNA methyltransferase [Paraburkholderia aspalathi]|uniref:Methyltransferase domain-containing protein n=1 Tax=Paraburkholderia aspalathi TaxID=1324617 RepID=A0A1I7EPN4_9BURK|nr:class I SAM-dependent methyltransferase [Paraburkholderia aspalathi]SFU25882.1 Methyltransferase domain-containing protein [Paraburkholderia aspalathi]